MRKLLLLLFGLLPLSIFQMNADDENTGKKIPLEMEHKVDLSRDMFRKSIECYYYDLFPSILTIINGSFNNISVSVTNYYTGESWYGSFDSNICTEYILQISGTPGIYEIVYLTESGEKHKGSFTIE